MLTMYVDICKYKRGNKTYCRSLLRISYREDGKVKHKTVGNLKDASMDEVLLLKNALAGNLIPAEDCPDLKTMQIRQGPSFGALFTFLTLAKRIGITSVLGSSKMALFVLWLIFARIIDQGSRLSAARLAERHAVKELMGLDSVPANSLYQALEWIAERQEEVEKQLLKKRYPDSKPQLFLYDVTSSYLEGTENELSNWGYNRDKKRGKMQIVIGLLTDIEGVPVAVRVFEGNSSDPITCLDQIKLLAESFKVENVTLVGDRGMIKSSQIKALNDKNFHFITAITRQHISTLVKIVVIQLDLFDEKITEVTDGDIRYVLRRNPIRAKEIAESRDSKFQYLERKIEQSNHYLKDHKKAKAEIQLRNLETYAQQLRIFSFVKLELTENKTVVLSKCVEMIEKSVQLDGCYAIKTDLGYEQIDSQSIHDRYKDLSKVEKAFRTMKTGFLEVRPIYVRKSDRTKGHVFITSLAYMITHEIRRLTTDRKDQPIEELIDQLTAINIIELKDKKDQLYRIPETDRKTQKILEQLDVQIPPFIPKTGLNVL